MKVRTNLTPKTIAAYNAMNWNHGEDIYTLSPVGDCWHEVLRDAYEDDPGYILDLSALVSDTEWQIEKHETMLEEDEAGACHQWYLEGDRDERTMKGLKEWRKGRREVAAYKSDLRKWESSAETCDPYWFDTDDVHIDFNGRGRAVA